MELQRQDLLTVGEGLIVVDVTPGEPRGAVRQVERIAVPMKYHSVSIGERRQARC